jgi:GNAT superfamily N-acetyltransferase
MTTLFSKLPIPKAPVAILACDDVIGTESDATGAQLNISFTDMISGSQAMSLFLKTYAEIMDTEFAAPIVVWADVNKSHCVYATDVDGKVVGGIVFEYRHYARGGWITLSFTHPEHRGRRINQILHKYLEEFVRLRGGDHIASHVHVDNASRLKSSERVGLKPQYYRMYQPLND